MRDGARGDGALSSAACSATGRSGPASAVELLERCKAAARAAERAARSRPSCSRSTVAVTDCNAAFFDAANDFAGCIAGCHEVLRRQGLLEGIWCLDPRRDAEPRPGARRSTGSAATYPDLNDDAFVAAQPRALARLNGAPAFAPQNRRMAVAATVPSFAPKVKVLGVEAFEQPFRLRMPFRFGVITVTEGLQSFLRVQLRLDDGREGFGYAAETLAAKWFDKSANLSDAQNQDQLRKSIEIAADAYREAPPSTAFDLFADNYRHQLRAGRELGLPPLVASYGNALRRSRRARRGLSSRRRQLLDGDAQQPPRHDRASGGRRPRRVRLQRLSRQPRSGLEHRGAPHRRSARPDHRR